jgi:hypothetical protein
VGRLSRTRFSILMNLKIHAHSVVLLAIMETAHHSNVQNVAMDAILAVLQPQHAINVIKVSTSMERLVI